MENTENTLKKPVWKKVVTIILNVLFYAFIVFLLVFAIANIAGRDKNNLPNIFGYGFCNVPTDSMENGAEDQIAVGDMVFVKVVKNEEQLSKLKKNEDIIVFFDENYNIFVIHRIVDIKDNADGTKTYITQGDNVAQTRPYAEMTDEQYNQYIRDNVIQSVSSKNVVATYTGSKWNGFGKVLAYLQTQAGFGLCIVLPTALLFLFEGYLLIRNIMELNKQKLLKQIANNKGEETGAETPEELEEKIRKLQEQLKNKNTGTSENNDSNTDK